MALAVILNQFNLKDPQVLPELGYHSQFNGIYISGTPNLYCETNVNLTLRQSLQMDLLGSVCSLRVTDP